MVPPAPTASLGQTARAPLSSLTAGLSALRVLFLSLFVAGGRPQTPRKPENRIFQYELVLKEKSPGESLIQELKRLRVA
jgi:hypothetical protein